MSAIRAESQSPPTQLLYDSATESFSIVLDVSPAAVEDVRVAVGSDTVEIGFDHPNGRYEQSFSPPTNRHVFDGDHEALYNNGILTVTVETVRQSAE